MEFIYLRRVMTDHGEKLSASSETSDEVAFLKAKTLLYVLLDSSLLEKDVNSSGDFMSYYPKYNTALKSVASTSGHPYSEIDDPTLVAVIPAKPFKPIWEQPGVAYIFGSLLENQTLFLEMLSSSKKWLDSHPDKLEEIKDKLQSSY